MKGFLSALRTVDFGIRQVEKGGIFIALVLMVFGIFIESVSRWAFDKGLPGMSEFARYTMVYVGFLGASVATSEKKHIVIDALAKAFADNKKLVAGMTSAAYLAGAVIVGFIAYACYVYLMSSGVQNRVSPALGLPLRYVAIIMPISAGFMTLRFLLIGLEELAATLGFVDYDYLRTSGGVTDLLEDAGMADATVDTGEV